MSKIKITLTDMENGNVRIDSDPPMPKLAEMRRNGDTTPAEGYALIALSSVIKTSLKEAQEREKAKLKSGIIMPQSPRFVQ